MTVSGVPEKLLDILRCPSCGGPVVEQADPASIVCGACGVRYPVNDGIPAMLVDEATPMSVDEIS